MESFSPQPTCVNQILVYTCQVNTFSIFTVWRHTAFESLGFLVGTEESTTNTSDGRVIANFNFITNDEEQIVVSNLTILPPLNNLNGTNLNDTSLTCEGLTFLGTISGDAPILLFGE